jgi:hypothetical protein
MADGTCRIELIWVMITEARATVITNEHEGLPMRRAEQPPAVLRSAGTGCGHEPGAIHLLVVT